MFFKFYYVNIMLDAQNASFYSNFSILKGLFHTPKVDVCVAIGKWSKQRQQTC